MNSALAQTFKDHFGTSPAFYVYAPGRVNLIGEHTDYNEGYVLPMAIERSIRIALRPRPDHRVRVHSLDYNQSAEFDLTSLQHDSPAWAEYIKGIAWVMQQEHLPVRGWEGILTGDIPRGAGLSSSAALEIAAALAFAAVADLDPHPVQLAKAGQRAENEWVGVRCGIMDQMASAASKKEHALLLDCRTLDYEHIPLPPSLHIAILDTGTRRGLVDSAYNERRAACERAAQMLGVPALRDISPADFQASASKLDEVTRRRAWHVVSENERVLQAVDALRHGDPVTLGQLLDASHASLRDNFEVSSPALDAMVTIARQQPGCYGARMTGAGFGGCAIALISAEATHEFPRHILTQYRQATGLEPIRKTGIIGHRR
jgi:galactokinase